MSHTIILNSNLRLPGSTTSEAKYSFNWDALPQGSYMMKWEFASSRVDATNFPDVMLIELSLGQQQNYKASLTGTRAENTYQIGSACLAPGGFTFYRGWNVAPGTYFKSLPRENEISVRLLTTAAVPTLWLDGGAVPAVIARYVLTLCFERID